MVDALADEISGGEGTFPDFYAPSSKPEVRPQKPNFEFITPETPFATRHFTVWFNKQGEAVRTNTEFIYSVSAYEAVDYAYKAVSEKDTRGWIDGYRYKVFSAKEGNAIVFVDGTSNIASLLRTIAISGLVLLSAGMVVLILIILFSKKAIKPVAEGYEKQKRFITDANHELKTPLTIILANLDIAESELGKNEWLDDMRSESERMRALVEELVMLSRLDEENETVNRNTDINLSDAVADTVSEFSVLSEQRNKKIVSEIEESLFVNADESLIRRLISILMDNAVKYCDAGGEITVRLKKRRNIVLSVENTYSELSEIELARLFDRFYRVDSARTYEGGFGIGLSMAKTICESHKFHISSYKRDETTIGFKVVF